MRITIPLTFVVLAAVAAGASATPPATETEATVAAAEMTTDRVEGFSHTFATQRELYDAVAAAVSSGDADVMRRMAVTEEEFRDLVWPTLDVAKLPNSNFTWEFVWSQHQLKHEKCLLRTSHDLGGIDFDIVDVSFLGATSDHGSFKIHRDSEAKIVRPDGTRESLQLFGSVLETDDGHYKIYSFIND